MRKNEFVDVTEFLPFSEAENVFLAWLNSMGIARDSLEPDDIEVMTVNSGKQVSLRRYSVRSAAIAEAIKARGQTTDDSR
jgi:hypothetical protein